MFLWQKRRAHFWGKTFGDWCAVESVSYWAVVLGVVCVLNRSKRPQLTHANRSRPFPICQSPQPLPLSWQCLHKLACICMRIHLFCSLSTNGIFSFFITLYLCFLIQSLCCVFHRWVSQQMAFSPLKPSGNVSKSFRESLEMNSDTEWIMMEAHCIGSWLSCICKYWLYGLVLCAFWIWPETLVFPSSSGSMRMMKYTVRTNASNLTLYVVLLVMKILPLFAEKRKLSMIWMWKPMWRLLLWSWTCCNIIYTANLDELYYL